MGIRYPIYRLVCRDGGTWAPWFTLTTQSMVTVYGIIGTLLIDAFPDGNKKYRALDILMLSLTCIEMLIRVAAAGIRNTLRSADGKIHAFSLLVTFIFFVTYGFNFDRDIVYLGLRCRIIMLLAPIVDSSNSLRILRKTIHLSLPVLRNVFSVAFLCTLLFAINPIREKYEDRCMVLFSVMTGGDFHKEYRGKNANFGNVLFFFVYFIVTRFVLLNIALASVISNYRVV